MENQSEKSEASFQSHHSETIDKLSQHAPVSNHSIRSPQSPQSQHSKHSQHSQYNRSLYSNRSVEPHGIEKYLITQERKNAEKYNFILANRIQKLLKEEENAKRLAEMAHNKTIAMMSNHERKLKEVQFKEMVKKKRQEQEEELRMKNFIERERRKNYMNQMQHSIIKQKQEVFKEIKKNEELGDQALCHFKSLIEQKKVEKAQVFKFQVELRKENRSRSHLNYKSKLRQEYEDRIQEEKISFENTLLKRKELEAMESQLMQKMSQSHNVEMMSPNSFGSHVFATSYSQSPEKFA